MLPHAFMYKLDRPSNR